MFACMTNQDARCLKLCLDYVAQIQIDVEGIDLVHALLSARKVSEVGE